MTWGDLEPAPYARHRVDRARRRAGRVRLGVPEGRPREPRRRRLAGARARGCASTWPGSRGRTASTRTRSPRCEGTGFRCAARRGGRPRASAARRRRRRARRPAVRRRDLRGVRLRAARLRAILAGRPEEYEAALSAALDRHAAASWAAKRVRGPLPARLLLGGARAGRLRRRRGTAARRRGASGRGPRPGAAAVAVSLGAPRARMTSVRVRSCIVQAADREGRFVPITTLAMDLDACSRMRWTPAPATSTSSLASRR